MEELPPDGENVSSDSSEELDSDKGTPRCHCSDSVSQAEEGEDGEELTEESAEEFVEEPTEELAEKSAEELTGESTEGPAEGPAEKTTVEHPTLGQESPLMSVRVTEERVVIHVLEEEIDHLC